MQNISIVFQNSHISKTLFFLGISSVLIGVILKITGSILLLFFQKRMRSIIQIKQQTTSIGHLNFNIIQSCPSVEDLVEYERFCSANLINLSQFNKIQYRRLFLSKFQFTIISHGLFFLGMFFLTISNAVMGMYGRVAFSLFVVVAGFLYATNPSECARMFYLPDQMDENGILAETIFKVKRLSES
jgi:hypothetical protein